MGNRTHTSLTREGEAILNTAAECFLSEETKPLAPYLSKAASKPVGSTEDQLNILGFEELARDDNRIIYTLPAVLTNIETPQVVKLPYGDDPDAGAADNLCEAAVWTRVNDDQTLQQFFMPVEAVAKNGLWLTMDDPTNHSISLIPAVLKTQYRRITRLLGRRGITPPINDETTVFYRGSVRLFDYAEIDSGSIQ